MNDQLEPQAPALATDFNPGSAPSGNMPFVISLACIKMNMTPEEAINAATMKRICLALFSNSFNFVVPTV